MSTTFLRVSLVALFASVLGACSDAPYKEAEKSLIEVHKELKIRYHSQNKGYYINPNEVARRITRIIAFF